MHTERKSLVIGIIRRFNPGKDRPQDGIVVYELLGGTIHEIG